MITPVLALVIPCYNEEEVLPETCERLSKIIYKLIEQRKIQDESFILFVNDGSSDRTWETIMGLIANHNLIQGIKLSKNFGHQNALLAGLMEVKDRVDCAISIDADLQQDENAIFEFIDKYQDGYDIVLGVRKSRDADTFIKKLTASSFYNLMSIMGVNVLKNHADYRLMSKKALMSLSEFSEINLFLRGIIPTLGYRTAIVYHEVKERFAGKSKYNFSRMFSLAINGITSFSIVPMRIITVLGFVIFILSLFMSIYVLTTYLITNTIAGWASTVLPIYFIGGIQVLSIGLLGEYVGKIYTEVKRRPRYIIEQKAGRDDNN